MKDDLILSIFCGIDLLGKAFEKEGFCVVKAGDKSLDGSDIRKFRVVRNKFNGIIGGSPCQDFSRLNRKKGNYGFEMLNEYRRVVFEASPDWYLFENVIGVPEFEIEGYQSQRFTLDLAWFSPFSRLRVFQFGNKKGIKLNPVLGVRNEIKGTAVTGGDERSFKTICEIQGITENLGLEFLSLDGKKQAVANGVPIQLGKYIAMMIKRDYYRTLETGKKEEIEYRRCGCSCGRVVTGNLKYAGASCRKRAQRKREKLAIDTGK